MKLEIHPGVFDGEPTCVLISFVHGTLVWGPFVWIRKDVQVDIGLGRTDVQVELIGVLHCSVRLG